MENKKPVEYRGSEALYSRVLQGAVDFLDTLPEKQQQIIKLIQGVKAKIATLIKG